MAIQAKMRYGAAGMGYFTSDREEYDSAPVMFKSVSILFQENKELVCFVDEPVLRFEENENPSFPGDAIFGDHCREGVVSEVVLLEEGEEWGGDPKSIRYLHSISSNDGVYDADPNEWPNAESAGAVISGESVGQGISAVEKGEGMRDPIRVTINGKTYNRVAFVTPANG